MSTDLARSVVEMAGLALLVAAAFVLSATIGLLVLGVALVLAANFGGVPARKRKVRR